MNIWVLRTKMDAKTGVLSDSLLQYILHVIYTTTIIIYFFKRD